MRSWILFTQALSISGAYATSLPSIIPNSAEARQIVRLEPGSWLENLAVRSNGLILATRLDIPSVYQVDPTTGSATVIANFTGVTGALGIAEYAPDVFAVVVGNYSLRDVSSQAGSYSLQTLDLSKGLGPQGKVTPSLLAKVPQAKQLNGLTFREPDTLYGADAAGFQILGVNITTRQASIAVPPNNLLARTDPTAVGPSGVNGIKWDCRGQQLYFTNSNQVLVGRVPYNSANKSFESPVLLARTTQNDVEFEDFDLDPFQGDLYLANGFNATVFLNRNGKPQFTIMPKNPIRLYGPTATKFGRGTKNATMYITTGGVNGTLPPTAGAQLLSYSFATTR